MDFHLYVSDNASRERFSTAWPTYSNLMIQNFDKLDLRHTVILHDSLCVLDEKFFGDIQKLVEVNGYLDALKHPAWMVFGNEYVKLRTGCDYWSFNFRPVIGFDDTTWKLYD